MKLAKVIGSVWATKKEKSLEGSKLIVARVYEPDTGNLCECIVAVDCVGAGVGELVLITTGSGSRKSQGGSSNLPIDATVVGIVDQVDLS